MDKTLPKGQTVATEKTVTTPKMNQSLLSVKTLVIALAIVAVIAAVFAEVKYGFLTTCCALAVANPLITTCLVLFAIGTIGILIYRARSQTPPKQNQQQTASTPPQQQATTMNRAASTYDLTHIEDLQAGHAGYTPDNELDDGYDDRTSLNALDSMFNNASSSNATSNTTLHVITGGSNLSSSSENSSSTGSIQVNIQDAPIQNSTMTSLASNLGAVSSQTTNESSSSSSPISSTASSSSSSAAASTTAPIQIVPSTLAATQPIAQPLLFNQARLELAAQKSKSETDYVIPRLDLRTQILIKHFNESPCFSKLAANPGHFDTNQLEAIKAKSPPTLLTIKKSLDSVVQECNAAIAEWNAYVDGSNHGDDIATITGSFENREVDGKLQAVNQKLLALVKLNRDFASTLYEESEKTEDDLTPYNKARLLYVTLNAYQQNLPVPPLAEVVKNIDQFPSEITLAFAMSTKPTSLAATHGSSSSSSSVASSSSTAAASISLARPADTPPLPILAYNASNYHMAKSDYGMNALDDRNPLDPNRMLYKPLMREVCFSFQERLKYFSENPYTEILEYNPQIPSNASNDLIKEALRIVTEARTQYIESVRTCNEAARDWEAERRKFTNYQVISEEQYAPVMKENGSYLRTLHQLALFVRAQVELSKANQDLAVALRNSTDPSNTSQLNEEIAHQDLSEYIANAPTLRALQEKRERKHASSTASSSSASSSTASPKTSQKETNNLVYSKEHFDASFARYEKAKETQAETGSDVELELAQKYLGTQIFIKCCSESPSLTILDYSEKAGEDVAVQQAKGNLENATAQYHASMVELNTAIKSWNAEEDKFYSELTTKTQNQDTFIAMQVGTLNQERSKLHKKMADLLQLQNDLAGCNSKLKEINQGYRDEYAALNLQQQLESTLNHSYKLDELKGPNNMAYAIATFEAFYNPSVQAISPSSNQAPQLAPLIPLTFTEARYQAAKARYDVAVAQDGVKREQMLNSLPSKNFSVQKVIKHYNELPHFKNLVALLTPEEIQELNNEAEIKVYPQLVFNQVIKPLNKIIADWNHLVAQLNAESDKSQDSLSEASSSSSNVINTSSDKLNELFESIGVLIKVYERHPPALFDLYVGKIHANGKKIRAAYDIAAQDGTLASTNLAEKLTASRELYKKVKAIAESLDEYVKISIEKSPF